MQVVIEEKLIKRNSRIGQILTVVSLVTLGGGMFITFKRPELLWLSITALLVGFLLSQIGIFYTNRWGRSPRPDEQVSLALKGLDKRYSLYHYQTPASHVLVGPAGVWVILPKHQRGTITYSKNRWRQSGGGFMQAYLKFFAQEGIGRPELEIDSETESLTKFLKKTLPAETEIPEIRAALIFSNPAAVIEADNAPAPTLPAKKLKDFMRNTAKERPISAEKIALIKHAIAPLAEDDEDETE